MPLRASPLRRLALSAAPLAAAVLAAACADSGPTATATGRLTVQLTDAPFPYDSVSRVDVFVVRADARREDADSTQAAAQVGDDARGRGGWVTIAEPRARHRAHRAARRRHRRPRHGDDPGRHLPGVPPRHRPGAVERHAQERPGAHRHVVAGRQVPERRRSGIKITLASPVVVPATGDGAAPPTLVIDFDLDDSFVLRGSSLGRDGLLFRPGIKASVTPAPAAP
jgi:hypothetical protein